MAKYRINLPQLSENLFLTDGGLETTLVFHDELDLPEFAAFTQFKTKAGRKAMNDYFARYAKIYVFGESQNHQPDLNP